MATLTFTQAPHGAYTTNQSPTDAVTGNAVTVSNSASLSGQYKIDDAPVGSAVVEGNLGAVGATASFTPDVAGGYMVSLWVAGARVAQLAIVVPQADGTLLPPYGARGDETDSAGNITLGNYRPIGAVAKGWKHVDATLKRVLSGSMVTHAVTVSTTLSRTESDADLLILSGAPGIERQLTFLESTRDGVPVVVWNLTDAQQTILDQDGSDYQVPVNAIATFMRSGTQLAWQAVGPRGGVNQVTLGNGSPGNVPEGAIVTIGGTAKAVVVSGAALGATALQPGAFASIGTPTHWYKCDEAAGSGATLANSGSAGAGGNATLTGSVNTDWVLGSSRLYQRGSKTGLVVHSTTTSIHAAATIAIGSGGSGTILVAFRLLATPPGGTFGLVTLDDGTSGNYMQLEASTSATGASAAMPGLWGESRIASTYLNTWAQYQPLPRGSFHTAALTWTSGASISLWMDGILVKTSATLGTVTAFTRLRIGNTSYLADVWRGSIGDVRLYSSVLTSAQIQQYAEQAYLL